ncbi:DNA-binding transcriptional LysR family regulator [Amycolatopsis lexingtonensis]|uniref:DNA-binding transcriptional LysR family regulator n=1 Tax=Amycolatopsis lexingtonensis TaxID=218822 RepID=A0ABR9IHP3_9PSEU|nr:LysR family transcriptional regulator [Amycolatopsis lexingtonensis]MBE1502704.1 DNA-binding transcriptional LysR family regulator [Amycolatopsis lexingtonensis]
MDLDLAQVRAFVVTAEQRHFGRAAAGLFLTQQALSKRIRKLEDALATPLFVRTNRSVELTAEGERFLPHARELVRVADAAVAAMGADDRPLRLDLLDYRLSPMFLLRRLAEREPALRVDKVAGGGFANAVEKLLSGELDAAFGRVNGFGRPLPDELEHRVVRLEPLVALLAPEHPLAVQDALPLTDLRADGIWLPGHSGPAEWLSYVHELCTRFGVPVDDSGVSYDLRHTLEQTRYGKRRVTLAGADMELAPDLNLKVLPFEPSPLFPWSLVWRRGKAHPALKRLTALAGRTSREEDWCAYDPAHAWVPDDDVILAASARTTP